MTMPRQANRRPMISVVAPVYNERDSLLRLYDEITRVLGAEGREFEIVLVNDCSSDESLELMLDMAATDPRVRVVDLTERSGQSAALGAGLRSARGEVIVTLDADLQNDPADIPMLLDRLDDYDVVSGVRAQRNDTWIRRAVSRVANGARRVALGDPFSDIGCSLKAYRAEYVRDLPVFDGMHRFLPVLAMLRGARVTELPVTHRPRYHGESKYGAIRGRFGRGLCDLVGVRWLASRWVLPPTHAQARLQDEAESGVPVDRRSEEYGPDRA